MFKPLHLCQNLQPSVMFIPLVWHDFYFSLHPAYTPFELFFNFFCKARMSIFSVVKRSVVEEFPHYSKSELIIPLNKI